MTAAEVLDGHFRVWATAACRKCGYPPASDAFFQSVRDRLTDPILEWIGYGLETGLIREHGLQFNVAGKPSARRYKWFSERSGVTKPQCNWEYYVQVAWFVRLWAACRAKGLEVSFEDKWMDLAVRRSGTGLLWCLEVKEQRRQVDSLLQKLGQYGSRGVDLRMPDRGDDPLRKAKYLVENQPEFFTSVAIGIQRHFRVAYTDGNRFSLEAATAPIDLPEHPPEAIA